MKKVIHKVFPLWSYDKEEQWLNDMSKKGYQLCDVGFCRYTFEEGLPGEYIYRLELLDNWPTTEQSKEYIRFLEDTGVEHVSTLLRWVYFRKKSGSSGFDLYSDVDSRIRHLNRILFLAGILAALNLFNGISLLFRSPAEYETDTNLVLGTICLAIGVLLGAGFLYLYNKKRKLKKEKLLHE
jgi:Protein of unknown function (DUF2812).